MSQKLLVIDDSVPIHSLVKVRLQAEGVDIHSAYDGESGLLRAAELQPDVILLDVDMPEMGGFEVCQRIKRDPKLAKAMVIFLTGATSTTDKIHGLNLGATDYVTKPFDAAELRARVRAALRMKYLVDLLEKKAMVDGLTGLWNRTYLDHRLGAELAATCRAPRPLGIVLFDCDEFKSVNDRFGHPVGDVVLRTFGSLMAAGCRTEDVVCRYGGEEFAVITPGVGTAGAAVLAERMRQRLEATVFPVEGGSLKVTCSAGVSELTDASERGVAEMIARADQALYDAKRAGRNRVVVAAGEPARPALAA